jgi:hypothetical protein
MDHVASEPAGPGVLERARIHAVLSFHDLWLRYFALGGDSGPDQVESYLTRDVDPGRRNYNLLVDALNERYTDLGLDRPILYAA